MNTEKSGLTPYMTPLGSVPCGHACFTVYLYNKQVINMILNKI